MKFEELSDPVQEILHGVFPDADLKSSIPRISKQAAESIFWRLTQYSLRDAEELANELSEFISSLNRTDDATLVNTTITPTPARLLVEDIELSSSVSQWENAFLTSFETSPSSAEFMVGRILFSAMRYGGLLQHELIHDLYLKVMYKVRPFKLNDVVWFELKNNNNLNTRWIPDSLSLLLIDQWLKTEWTLTRSRGKWNYYVSIALSSRATIRPSEFFTVIAKRLALEVTPALIDIATGDTVSVQLKRSAFFRLITRRSPPLKIELPTTKPKTLESIFEKFSSTADKALMRRMSSLVDDANNEENKKPGALSNTLQNELDAFEGRVSENLHLSGQWLAHRLINQGSWSGPLAIGSASRRFKTVNAVLSNIPDGNSILSLTENEVSDLYSHAINKRKNASSSAARARTKTVAATLRDFHDFIVHHYDATPNYEPDKVITQGAKKHPIEAVDADVLMPWEYEAIKNRLVKEINQLSRRNSQISQILFHQALLVVFMLGYRTGMRRSEIQYLRVGDIHNPQKELSSSTECVVMPNELRSLKTESGYRDIPVGVLLTPAELNSLNDFWSQRRIEGGDGAFLFNIPGQKRPFLDSRVLFEPIHWLLKSVTGNPRMRFHHLRHSFATWRFWSWMSVKFNGRSVMKSLGDITSCDAAVKERERILGLRNGVMPSRKVLHALSMAIGHSHPQTTLRHYIHSTDLVLHAELQHIQPIFEKKTLASLAGISLKGLYKLARDKAVDACSPSRCDYTPALVWSTCLRRIEARDVNELCTKDSNDSNDSTTAFTVLSIPPRLSEQKGSYNDCPFKPSTSFRLKESIKVTKEVQYTSIAPVDTYRTIDPSALSIIQREPSGKRLAPIDRYMAAFDFYRYGYDVRTLEEKYEISANDIQKTLQQARRLFNLTKRIGNTQSKERPRHFRKIRHDANTDRDPKVSYVKQLPPLSRQVREMITIEKMLVAADKLDLRIKRRLRKALDYFVNNSTAYESGIDFTRRQDLESFVSAMKLLNLDTKTADGNSKSRLRITLYLPYEDKELTHKAISYWNKVIEFEAYQITRKIKKRSIKHDYGYVLIDLLATKPESSSKSERRRVADGGFKIGLYILYLNQNF
ncbi:tyrosine-type recombinase/integrase [Idiomarina loihiensis]|uniref:tyrosine-type recombinase/integrase n=1 Tax=Idiomarina loihiensis TaxID=135577 RepID=UPI00385011A1